MFKILYQLEIGALAEYLMVLRNSCFLVCNATGSDQENKSLYLLEDYIEVCADEVTCCLESGGREGWALEVKQDSR